MSIAKLHDYFYMNRFSKGGARRINQLLFSAQLGIVFLRNVFLSTLSTISMRRKITPK